jgi:hypothetical protein
MGKLGMPPDLLDATPGRAEQQRRRAAEDLNAGRGSPPANGGGTEPHRRRAQNN